VAVRGAMCGSVRQCAAVLAVCGRMRQCAAMRQRSSVCGSVVAVCVAVVCGNAALCEERGSVRQVARTAVCGSAAAMRAAIVCGSAFLINPLNYLYITLNQ
jgi:hypothetical protein